jgi:hypothetical protein
MLLRGLQSEAAAAGKPLRIHVERFNPALRLYERLGFTPIADRGVYLFMEWTGADIRRSAFGKLTDLGRVTWIVMLFPAPNAERRVLCLRKPPRTSSPRHPGRSAVPAVSRKIPIF